jgi:allophanate hydrolase subunit 2
VPACVIRADVGRIAQLRTGDRLAFTSVSPEEARAANRRAEEQLAAIEASEENGLGWIGSHG